MQPRRFPFRWALLASLLGGLIGVAAFPKLGMWPLAPLSVALLSFSVDRRPARQAALLGFVYGATFLIPLLSWTGVYVGAFPWLLLAVFESLFFAVMAVALAAVQRLPIAVLAVPAVWVLQEAARDRLPFGGFPWGRLAFSQSASPLRWYAALGGAPLLTFTVALAGAGLAIALRAVLERRWRVVAGGVTAMVAVAAVGGLLALPLRPTGGQQTTVALVQGNIPELGLQFESRAGQVLDNHVAETLKLAAEIKSGVVARPSLVVWPEDSSDLDPFDDPAAYKEIASTVKTLGIPVLVGAILDGPGPTHRRNVGILWSPTTGPGDEYTKRHPVPFGEYIPLRGIAGFFSSDVNLVTQDMVPGHGNGLVTGGPFPFGDVICFEVAYDDLVRSSVQAGAQLLVVQTNNATFGRTAETYQQLAMSRLRAVENGRTVVQVSTTGISAVIAPDGSVSQQSPALFQPDILDATVALRTATTLATRLGALPEYLLAAVGLLATAWAAYIRRRRSPPGGVDALKEEHGAVEDDLQAQGTDEGVVAR
jgi:apolipoprotein N-acyltransferase